MPRFLKVDYDLEWLLEEASEVTIRRGQDYFLKERVIGISLVEDVYHVSVRGTEPYELVIDPDAEYADCECPAPYPCKHVIAAVYAISAMKDEITSKKETSEPLGKLVILVNQESRFFLRVQDQDGHFQRVSMPYDLLLAPEGTAHQASTFTSFGNYYTSFSFNEFTEKTELDFDELPLYYTDGTPVQIGRSLSLHCRITEAEPEAPEEDDDPPEQELHIEYYYVDPFTGKKEIYQTDSAYHFDEDKVLLAKTSPENSPNSNEPHYTLHTFTPKHPDQLHLRRFQKQHDSLSAVGLLLYKQLLRAAQVEDLDKYTPRTFPHGPTPVLSLYPVEGKRLKIRARWELLYSSGEEYIPNEKKISRALASKDAENLFARFEMISRRAKYFVHFEKSENGNLAEINFPAEHEIITSLEETPFFNGKKGGKAFRKEDIYNFIDSGADNLKKQGVHIQIHSSLAKLLSKDYLKNATFQINPSSDIDWFEGQIEAGGMTLKELRVALAAYRKKEEFVQVGGQWVSLEMIGIEGLMKSLDQLGIKVLAEGTVKKISRGEALAIAIEAGLQTRTNKAIEELKERIEAIPQKREKSKKEFQTLIQGKLRDYQKEGILFLESLYESGFGGILADDMGLGKTIQGLGFLSRLQERKKAGGQKMLALIAGPLASISVWQKECEKFFPDLSVTLWHGAGRARNDLPREGILLTTYGTLLRDFQEWQDQIHFDVALLDEAQNLKNFRSLSSHAVRQTSVDAYFCLSGTPLENHLSDLWSLFDIIFPGYLGAHKAFSKQMQNLPLEELRQKIEPFILRRAKSEVLKELPPLTETLAPVPMTPRQKKFYEEARKMAMIELATARENYLMVMLPHLTRLRRIACHPEAGNPDGADLKNSGKFQYLKESLPELAETASGILIFSQYTDILKICKRLVEELGLECFYLDGKTSPKKREKMVTQFQAGERPIFLISLKAGGTALTLHQADTVIHLDPWWNPAAERQASDRAHRIGQKRKVFVYKLYSQESIEEKVIELQKRKLEIFNALFGEAMQSTGEITREQLMELLSEA